MNYVDIKIANGKENAGLYTQCDTLYVMLKNRLYCSEKYKNIDVKDTKFGILASSGDRGRGMGLGSIQRGLHYGCSYFLFLFLF